MKTIKKYYSFGTEGSYHLCQDARGLFLQWGGPESDYARIRGIVDIAFELANTKMNRNRHHFESFDEAVKEILQEMEGSF